uniref:Sushi domain-containing protein n=1 Tax=Strigamia maritima TaxID=126957 RepID=T1JLJ7_STRMM
MSCRYNSYWAGIRQVEDSKWVFMDYSVLGNFSYWAPKEPDGNENEDCVLLAAHVQTKWVTTQCHWGYRFICQLVDACDVQDLAIFYNLQIRLNFNNTEENTKLFSVGARVNVECAPGFVSLKGPSHLHCEIGGKWRNSTFCSKGCIAPNLPSTVRLLRSQPMYSVGDNLSLGCDSGHVLKGNLKCEDDGKWFGEAPACITINIPLQPRPNQPQIQCPKVANVTLFGVEEAEIKFVPMGTSIKLPCVKNVKIWPNGLWMRDQQVLVAKINIPTVSIHNNGTLIIGSMSSATEGLYTCIAFGSEQEPKVNYHSVRLILPRECNLKFDPAPTVHILSTHFVLLRCQ